MLVKFGMASKSQNCSGESSSLLNEPVIGQGQQFLRSEQIGNFGEESAPPLGNLLAFWEKTGFYYLKEVITHIVLLDHLLNDII